jgi:hypothetical protein
VFGWYDEASVKNMVLKLSIKFIGSRLVLPQVPSPYQRWYLHTYRGHLGWYCLRSYQPDKVLASSVDQGIFYKKYFQFFWFLNFGEFFFKILAIIFFFFQILHFKNKIPNFLGHHSAKICPKREIIC